MRDPRRLAVLLVRVGRRDLRILPFAALKTLGIAVGALVLAAIGLDRIVMPGLARDLVICPVEWQAENAVINANAELKNHAGDDGDWLWRSTGIPATPRREGRTRILVMGDSFVWGDGYANVNDTWWRQLERELIARGHDVEVVAAGMRGASTAQQIEPARALIATEDPDVVVWGYVANDPDEQLVRHAPTDFKTIASDDAAAAALHGPVLGPLLPRLSDQLFAKRMDKLAEEGSGPSTGWTYATWELKLLEGESFARYRGTVAALAAMQRESGRPAFVLTLPSLPSRERFAPRFEPVRPLFEAEGIPFVDALDALVARFPEGTLDGATPEGPLAWGINPANGHPCPEVCSVHAQVAADWIEAHDLVPKGRQAAPIRRPPRINDWMPFDLDPVADGPNAWTFVYPASADRMLSLPGGLPFVQLSLALPVAASSVRLSGEGLGRARLAVTATHAEHGHDDRVVRDLGERHGSELSWDLAPPWSARLNTIRVAAAPGASRRLRIEIVPAAPSGPEGLAP